MATKLKATGATAGTSVNGAVPAITTIPAGFLSKVEHMLQGIQQVLPPDLSLTTSAGSVVLPTLVAQLQAMATAYQAVAADELALKRSRGQLHGQLPLFHQQYTAMKILLTAYFGQGAPELAQFGIKPKAKSRTLTPEELVARSVRSKETRKLRGTMGPRKKQSVVFRGSVNVTTDPQPAVKKP